MKIVISSGHGKLVRGAGDIIDEVDEARKVVNRVAELLADSCTGKFHDDTSTSQNQNLNAIVGYHNSKIRDLDVSVHFNAYEHTTKGMGTECLYVTQADLAAQVSQRICNVSGLWNRGPKKRTDLFFLNNTNKPAILIEVCFVDSEADVNLYRAGFDAICVAIAEAISGVALGLPKPPDQTPEPAPEPPVHDDPAKVLIYIDPVYIWKYFDGAYVAFISDLDICNDGSGPSHDDPSYQPETAYYNKGKFLNADEDRYIVIPPQVRQLLKPTKVMGCQARLTNLASGTVIVPWTAAVCGEIGPDDKTGEAAYCAAKIVNPTISYNTGDKSRRYLYEIWPGVPATVGNKTYALE